MDNPISSRQAGIFTRRVQKTKEIKWSANKRKERQDLNIETICPIKQLSMANMNAIKSICRSRRRKNDAVLRTLTNAALSNGSVVNISYKSTPYPTCAKCQDWKKVFKDDIVEVVSDKFILIEGV